MANSHGNPDWNAIRAEYIGGGISQRKLAKKYGVSENTLIRKANKEKWCGERDKTYNDVNIAVQQKTVVAASNNALIAQRIKEKLLKRLEKEIDALPENIGTESSKIVSDNQFQGKNRVPSHTEEIKRAYKLRDLTAAYKDLTEDMPMEEDSTTMEKLDKLLEVAWNASHTETSGVSP